MVGRRERPTPDLAVFDRRVRGAMLLVLLSILAFRDYGNKLRSYINLFESGSFVLCTKLSLNNLPESAYTTHAATVVLPEL